MEVLSDRSTLFIFTDVRKRHCYINTLKNYTEKVLINGQCKQNQNNGFQKWENSTNRSCVVL